MSLEDVIRSLGVQFYLIGIFICVMGMNIYRSIREILKLLEKIANRKDDKEPP
jgi:hypothetical protein